MNELNVIMIMMKRGFYRIFVLESCKITHLHMCPWFEFRGENSFKRIKINEFYQLENMGYIHHWYYVTVNHAKLIGEKIRIGEDFNLMKFLCYENFGE